MRLRYEDMVRDPGAALRSILGDPMTAADVMAFDHGDDGPSHAIAGNPTRFTTGQRIAPDERWRTEMAAADRAAATAITAPLLRRFGYRLRTSAT